MTGRIASRQAANRSHRAGKCGLWSCWSRAGRVSRSAARAGPRRVRRVAPGLAPASADQRESAGAALFRWVGRLHPARCGKAGTPSTTARDRRQQAVPKDAARSTITRAMPSRIASTFPSKLPRSAPNLLAERSLLATIVASPRGRFGFFPVCQLGIPVCQLGNRTPPPPRAKPRP